MTHKFNGKISDRETRPYRYSKCRKNEVMYIMMAMAGLGAILCVVFSDFIDNLFKI